MLQLGFLKLLHGAAMREEPEEFPCVFSEDPPHEVQKTPWLSPEELAVLRAAEDALERCYNSGRLDVYQSQHHGLHAVGREALAHDELVQAGGQQRKGRTQQVKGEIGLRIRVGGVCLLYTSRCV